jgi:hypothetical protein
MFRLVVFIFFATAFQPFMACAQTSEREPIVRLDVAIKKANEYLQAKKIDVSNSYLESVVLEQNLQGDRAKSWLLTWQLKSWSKGGQVFVRVYMDGQVKHTFGE